MPTTLEAVALLVFVFLPGYIAAKPFAVKRLSESVSVYAPAAIWRPSSQF